jgi:hypothetical protein
MPTVEVEIGDDGKIGTLPEAVQKFLDKRIGEATSSAKAAAAKDLEAKIADLKRGGLDAADRERLKTLEGDLSRANEEVAKAKGDAAEAERIRSERHAKELKERDDKVKAAHGEVDKRTKRIRELVGKDIKIAALQAGAREESLDELEQLLGPSIGLDDALQAFVQDANEAGKARLDKDGKPVSIEGFVAEYLTAHPHHKSAPVGRGGRATGGRSLSGQKVSGVEAEKAAALELVSQNPSISNIARALSRAGAA